MKWIKVAIGAVIAISVIPMIVTSISSLTGVDGDLAGTIAGTLLDLAPIVFVAGVLSFLFISSGGNNL